MCFRIVKRPQLWSMLLLLSALVVLVLPVRGYANPLAWSDDLVRWAIITGKALTPKAAKEATDAGRYTANDFARMPSGLLIPKVHIPIAKAPLIESVELLSGKVSSGEIAKVWGISIRVGEVEVYKLIAPLFYGGIAYCIGARCTEHIETNEMQDQLNFLQSIDSLIVIDCHQEICMVYRVAA